MGSPVDNLFSSGEFSEHFFGPLDIPVNIPVDIPLNVHGRSTGATWLYGCSTGSWLYSCTASQPPLFWTYMHVGATPSRYHATM